MSRYSKIIDGVGFAMRSAQKFKLACCDCGLVHNVVIVARRGGHFGMAMERNKRATSALRSRNKHIARVRSRPSAK